MNVLFAVSECLPFSKTGGLADVAGSLPRELIDLGTNVSVIMPLYDSISTEYKSRMEYIDSFDVEVGWRKQYAGIKWLEEDGVTYYFIDNEYYFKRDALYGFFDDGERFSFFSKAALEAIPYLFQSPNILHCHDWHTGIIPFLLHEYYQELPAYWNIKTVFTIHNLHFQGLFPKETLHELLNINSKYFTKDYLEFHDLVSFMKAGIVSSNYVTTVSPTYCEEIKTEYFGEGLDGLLRKKGDQLIGILNGIDDRFYNPANDPYIPAPYQFETIRDKAINKTALQRYFKLPEEPHVPIVALISRLTKQKGLELVTHMFHELMEENVQFIILGTGDETFEHFFKEMTYTYPDQVRSFIGFDEKLAHLVYSGADLFLMPSKFEPCGLGQMIAMKYGTVPIVRETGGLNDTVHSYNEITQLGNGFSFTHFNAHDMLFTIKRAISFYHDKQHWSNILKQAMSQDFSWSQSAFIYNQLYSKLCKPVRSEQHVLKQGTV
ncbi:starch synthase [Bacillus mesophilus]|uniref:Glycogen synthase n=1 Tax=Bacillus mesophilus TaxID=1808955 RepID=A0A6M0Q6U5_9BACI|nr:glycogen synthase GlgA [Bacillus mesophilus]MBM7660421.1 starch synthase [Bacillus mesophilus]NEY72027.1 glycogen synthase GlgA [Bacillus mesophilus]